MWVLPDFQSSIWWINILLATLVIYLRRHKSARSTMMWVMIFAFLPVIGFVLYLFWGQDYRRAKMFRLKAEQDEMVRRFADAQSQEIQQGLLPYNDPMIGKYSGLISLNLHSDNSYYSQGNQCALFFDGKSKFESLFRDIDGARQSIDLQYYIMKPDEVGWALLNRLGKAAARGVAVRMLVDAVGGRYLSQREFQFLQNAGVRVAIFFPSLLKLINFRMNYRNHRKLVIIDQQISYIGGFNVGDEYAGKDRYFGRWRDTHLRIQGTASADLQIRFLKDWLYASGDDPSEQPDVISFPMPGGDVGLQLVTSGPDTQFHNIKYAMINLISSAERTIYIQTPYLVPDAAVMDVLTAKLIAGCEVNIMLPDRLDHPVIYWATMSYAGELLRAGARVYCYNAGFLHAKVLIVDELVSIVGSANMDERSFSLNFEASEVIYNRRINAQLRAQFQKDIEESTLVTKESYEQRPLMQRIKEPVARLFSPLL